MSGFIPIDSISGANFYGLSPQFSGSVSSTDWTEFLEITTEQNIPVGAYELSFGLDADFPALQYVLEWRTRGSVAKGPYTEGGFAVAGVIARTYTYPLLHFGGPISISIDMRIPQLGFDIIVSEAFLTLKFVSSDPTIS